MSSSSSLSQNEIQLDPSICTAIIFSTDGLSVYTVEIRIDNNSYFIKSHGLPVNYPNIANAVAAARHEKAKIAYLATSLTYEDVGAFDTELGQAKPRYSYQLISMQTE